MTGNGIHPLYLKADFIIRKHFARFVPFPLQILYHYFFVLSLVCAILKLFSRHYFSGTGNSLRTARIIAAEMGSARLVSMRGNPEEVSASSAKVIGFVCPVYEWDVPQPVKAFVERLFVNPQAYLFMVATYIAVHGRCFETTSAALEKKGAHLQYGKGMRCVANQCTAYEPFPPKRFMPSYMEKNSIKIGKEIAAGRKRKVPMLTSYK